jgi:hypothetical protein
MIPWDGPGWEGRKERRKEGSYIGGWLYMERRIIITATLSTLCLILQVLEIHVWALLGVIHLLGLE